MSVSRNVTRGAKVAQMECICRPDREELWWPTGAVLEVKTANRRGFYFVGGGDLKDYDDPSWSDKLRHLETADAMKRAAAGHYWDDGT